MSLWPLPHPLPCIRTQPQHVPVQDAKRANMTGCASARMLTDGVLVLSMEWSGSGAHPASPSGSALYLPCLMLDHPELLRGDLHTRKASESLP